MKRKKKKNVKFEEPILIYSDSSSEYNKNLVRESSNYIADYIWDEMGCLKEYTFNRI